jgi:hypothetical protein
MFRILTPDGIIEVWAEDIPFPGATVCKPPSNYLSAPKRHGRTMSPRPPLSSISSPTDPRDSSLERPSPTSASLSSADLLQPSRMRLDSQDSVFSPVTPLSLDEPEPEFDSTGAENPLDHTRLAAAWEEMLSARDIPVSPTSVFPLYLSAVGTDYRVLPALQVRMPGAAPLTVDRMALEEEQADIDTYGRKVGRKKNTGRRNGAGTATGPSSRNGDGDRASLGSGLSGETLSPLSSLASMHLARLVQIVRCCKDALWEAYEVLYSPHVDTGPRAVKVAQGDMVQMHDSNRSWGTREKFEHDWHNWQTCALLRLCSHDANGAPQRHGGTNRHARPHYVAR